MNGVDKVGDNNLVNQNYSKVSGKENSKKEQVVLKIKKESSELFENELINKNSKRISSKHTKKNTHVRSGSNNKSVSKIFNEVLKNNLLSLQQQAKHKDSKLIELIFSSKMKEMHQKGTDAILISKRDHSSLQQSYFLLKSGEIVLKPKKSEEDSKLASGGMKEVYKLHNSENKLSQVLGVVKPEAKKHVNVNFLIQMQKLFKDNHNISVGYHIQWKSKSGEIQDGFVSSYMSGPDVGELIDSVDLPNDVRIDAMLQAVRALKVIHAKKVCHFDIKPENFLVNYTPKDPGDPSQGAILEVKLSDFDTAKEFKSDRDMKYFSGTPGYIEPQFGEDRLVLGLANGISVDVYSLGETFKVIWNARPESKNDSVSEVSEKAKSGEGEWNLWSYEEEESSDDEVEEPAKSKSDDWGDWSDAEGEVEEKVGDKSDQGPNIIKPWNERVLPSPEPEKNTVEHLFWSMTHPHRDKRCSLDEVEAQLLTIHSQLKPNTL